MAQIAQRVWTDEDVAALFDRFFAPLFDVAVRVLGRDDEAASAVGRTFSRTAAELRLHPLDDIRPRLYALLVAELPRRQASRPGNDGRFAQIDHERLANPALLADEADVAAALWAAVSALPLADYLLLDLQLRHGLRDPELARALRLDARAVERRLDRLRERLDGAVESPISPVALFAALEPALPPPGLPERVWADLRAAPQPKVRRSRPRITPPRKPILAAAGLALLAAAASAGAYYAVRGPGVHNPRSLHSTTHSLEQGSANPDVTIAWDPSRKARGYSISWSAAPATPDQSIDLQGSASKTTRHLKPGTSWFNLRTLGKNGWTDAVHLGPFLILPDTIVPETTISAGPRRFGTADVTFRFASNEAHAALECSLDGATFKACTPPARYTGLRAGAHTFRVRAVDEAGNTDPTPARRAWQVDTSAPRTTLTESPAEFERKVSRFEFESSEGHSSFECKLDGAKYEPCSSPKSYPGLADGRHRFRVRALDRAGNPDPSPISRKWTVDTHPPETTIDAGPPDPSHKPTGTFTLSSEVGASFQCRLDHGRWGDCGPLSGLTDGRHILRARALDRAENSDPTPARWTWTVDLPPGTTITSGPKGATASTSATFRFSSPDSAATFQCRIDDGLWSTCAPERTYSGLAQGSHVFRVRAKDAGGVRDPSPARRTWKVDTHAPATTITSGPNLSTTSRSATFRFSSSEKGVDFQCRLDAGSWSSCASPRSYSKLKKGDHDFEVRAVDAAGNVDSTPDFWSWKVK
ncbi:MAG TPA: hypothetical protein VFW80_01350 [Gaiellaceae bacterium]|nr:hypothetical protein [Gaiellaceae bacterium]